MTISKEWEEKLCSRFSSSLFMLESNAFSETVGSLCADRGMWSKRAAFHCHLLLHTQLLLTTRLWDVFWPDLHYGCLLRPTRRPHKQTYRPYTCFSRGSHEHNNAIPITYQVGATAFTTSFFQALWKSWQQEFMWEWTASKLSLHSEQHCFIDFFSCTVPALNYIISCWCNIAL
jgi:hypothetical protein